MTITLDLSISLPLAPQFKQSLALTRIFNSWLPLPFIFEHLCVLLLLLSSWNFVINYNHTIAYIFNDLFHPLSSSTCHTWKTKQTNLQVLSTQVNQTQHWHIKESELNQFVLRSEELHVISSSFGRGKTACKQKRNSDQSLGFLRLLS